MKAFGLALSLMLLPTLSAHAQQAAPAHSQISSTELNAVFMFGRARAFHDMVEARQCRQMDAQKVDAIDQRFAAAQAQLANRFGPSAVPKDQPLPAQLVNQPCLPPTIDSYSNHVRELEQYLANLGPQA